MIHQKPRRYNGAARTLDDLLGRCVVDDATGCWHFRDSCGRPFKPAPGKCLRVFLASTQRKVSARRAAWDFTYPDKPAGDGVYVASVCRCFDCINPAHACLATPAKLGKMIRQDGRAKTPSKRANALRQARTRAATRMTLEVAQWVRESGQKQADAAHGAMTTQTRVSDIRLGKLWRTEAVLPGASVFSWGGA